MPKGTSGRIVVHVDAVLKRRLYSALAMDNKTLKQWFIQEAERYLQTESSPDAESLPKDQDK